MDFLELAGKKILVLGVANRKSVAFHIGRLLSPAGAEVIYSVRTPARQASLARLFPGRNSRLRRRASRPDSRAPQQRRGRPRAAGWAGPFDRVCRLWGRAGAVSRDAQKRVSPLARHFLLFADRAGSGLQGSSDRRRFGRGPVDFDHAHGQRKLRLHGSDQGRARFVAGFSGQIVQQFFPRAVQRRRAGPVENVGFGRNSRLRDAYLYAEQATLRKRAVATDEVANVAAFLLSRRSSGINAQTIVVDAGMSVNYFDRELVRRSLDGKPPQPEPTGP